MRSFGHVNGDAVPALVPEPAGSWDLVVGAADRRRCRGRYAVIGDLGAGPLDPARWPAMVVDGAVPLCRPDPPPPHWPVRCTGQLAALPPGRYDWLYLLVEGCAAHAEEEVWLHYRTGVDQEWLRPLPGGSACRVPVTRPDPLVALRLPDRPELRLVAATLVAALAEAPGAS